MNKRNLPRTLLLAATVGLACSAGAQTVDNWKSGDGALVWKNGTNELCWRDSSWTPATAHPDCDGAIKPLPPVLLALGLYSGLSLPDNGQPMLVLDVESMMARHGVMAAPVVARVADDARDAASAAAQADARIPWLSFRQTVNGPLLAVPMATVERISDVAVEALSQSGGRMLAHVDATLLPVHCDGFDLPESGKLRLIRLGDGCRSVMIPACEISHVLDLAPELPPQNGHPGLIGTALFDGAPVDLMDAYDLLSRFGREVDRPAGRRATTEPSDAGNGRKTIWIIDQSGGEWAAGFLVPSLTSAGFDVRMVADRAAITGDATHVLTMDPHGVAAPLSIELAGKLHRLSAESWAGKF